VASGAGLTTGAVDKLDEAADIMAGRLIKEAARTRFWIGRAAACDRESETGSTQGPSENGGSDRRGCAAGRARRPTPCSLDRCGHRSGPANSNPDPATPHAPALRQAAQPHNRLQYPIRLPGAPGALAKRHIPREAQPGLTWRASHRPTSAYAATEQEETL
jgi:hypothetical protein